MEFGANTENQGDKSPESTDSDDSYILSYNKRLLTLFEEVLWEKSSDIVAALSDEFIEFVLTSKEKEGVSHLFNHS